MCYEPLSIALHAKCDTDVNHSKTESSTAQQPYFTSKSKEHDVTLMSFYAKYVRYYEIFFCIQGVKICSTRQTIL